MKSAMEIKFKAWAEDCAEVQGWEGTLKRCHVEAQMIMYHEFIVPLLSEISANDLVFMGTEVKWVDIEQRMRRAVEKLEQKLETLT